MFLYPLSQLAASFSLPVNSEFCLSSHPFQPFLSLSQSLPVLLRSVPHFLAFLSPPSYFFPHLAFILFLSASYFLHPSCLALLLSGFLRVPDFSYVPFIAFLLLPISSILFSLRHSPTPFPECLVTPWGLLSPDPSASGPKSP